LRFEVFLAVDRYLSYSVASYLLSPQHCPFKFTRWCTFSHRLNELNTPEGGLGEQNSIGILY